MNSTPVRLLCLTWLALGFASGTALQAQKTNVETSADPEAVVLSAFEVRSDRRGYYASNTMSGTRLNSKIEDLASSISVVTKEQMADFALLDINDVFLYEAVRDTGRAPSDKASLQYPAATTDVRLCQTASPKKYRPWAQSRCFDSLA